MELCDATRILCPEQTGVVRLPDWKAKQPGATVLACGPMFAGFRFVAALNEGSDSRCVDPIPGEK